MAGGVCLVTCSWQPGGLRPVRIICTHCSNTRNHLLTAGGISGMPAILSAKTLAVWLQLCCPRALADGNFTTKSVQPAHAAHCSFSKPAKLQGSLKLGKSSSAASSGMRRDDLNFSKYRSSGLSILAPACQACPSRIFRWREFPRP